MIRTFSFTEREQTLLTAAVFTHWAKNAGGDGFTETEGSREVAALLARLHAEGAASFVGPDANRPAER